MSAPTREVPKFSSFRAKKVPSQDQVPPPSSSSSHPTSLKRRRSSESRHRSVKRNRTPEPLESAIRRDKQSSRHSLDASRHDREKDEAHRSPEPSASNKSPVIRHDRQSDLFVFDGKGDRQNVAYERLHKYSIPTYQRIGYGSIMGLSHRFKIDRTESTIDKVYIIDKSAASKHNTQRLLLKRQRNTELPPLRTHDHAELDLNEDFVVFSSSAERRSSVSSDEGLDSFKHLDQPKNSDLHESQTQETSNVAPDTGLEARQQNITLVRATKAYPTNIQAWLDLAAHQEYLVNPGANTQRLSNMERQILADMRIAVYEKALKNFSSIETPERERLVLALLHEASLAWDTQKYMQKLRDVLQQHPKSFSIWTRNLDFCQANPIKFRFEDVKAFFIRSLQTLGSGKSVTRGPETSRMQLYLILRYTVFLLDAGYDELSIATWQALCEYHFFRPDHLSTSTSTQALAEFEQFWESEAARFGEIGARGWCASSQDSEVTSSAQQPVPDIKLTLPSPFKSFCALEEITTSFLRFPGRTLDEVGAEDPFHVVFFSDIKDIVEATAGGFNRLEFLDALLCYLGIPEMGNMAAIDESTPAHEWRSDVFLHHGLLQTDTIHKTSSQLYGFSVQRYRTITAFESLPMPGLSEENAHYPQSIHNTAQFARRVLSSLVHLFSDDQGLAECHLAFELSYFPKEASKVAKSILRKRPSCLRLYNACAIIESKLGNAGKAAQIWSGAIQMKDSFPVASQQEFVLLWRSWIWCDLEAGQEQKALSRLTSFVGDKSSTEGITSSIPTATLLRLRQGLRDGFEDSISQSRPHLAALNAELLALAAYMTDKNALQASVDTIQAQCNVVLQRSTNSHVLLELLHQAKACIIAHHIRQKRPYKPAFVRLELESSIALFPNNTIFLEMYRENEARFRLDDRVRSILKTQVLINNQLPLVAWSFAIGQELLRFRNQSSGSTAESVRATFSRALLATGSPVRHSVTLWTKWFQFEEQMVYKETTESHSMRKRSTTDLPSLKKLKQVLLSGLKILPWSKDWILRGMRAFERDDGLGWDMNDLRRLHNVLTERELRVRVEGLEDIIDHGIRNS
jgi:hypothetical protein